MIDAGKFFVPGPTEVRPEILDAMRRPLIFHRSAEMEALMRRVTPRLGAVFGTRRPVHVITGSGTAAMELAVRNGTLRNVLSIVHGDFGARFAKMAESNGRTVTQLKSDVGDVVPIDSVRDALRAGEYDAVTVTHSETAVGVLADIAAVAALVRKESDALVLVDGVSSAGAAEIQMDAWGIDAVVSASQKALALPPGLAFAAVSERFVERAKTIKDRGTYLDVVRFEEFAAKAQSPTTPAVSLLFALDRQLEDVEREGVTARFARHSAMERTCSSRLERMASSGIGLEIVAKQGHRSPSVTCIKPKADAKAIVKRMRAKGFELGGGQAPVAKTTFRIGHMGDHTVRGVEAMLDVLEAQLREEGNGTRE